VEDIFVSDGFGVNRKDVMYNEFVIVGPLHDPAGIQEETDILKILGRFAESNALFISRGDHSGTHNREIQLWDLAGISPQDPWYKTSSKGMLATLQMASSQQAYVLTDMSTFLFNQQNLNLVILAKGDERLFNPYGVIAVNPTKVEDVNFEGAMAFIDFITSEEGQKLIRDYGKERFGKPLFTPMALIR
jgi:tungstate transport system substrate-binding protein